MIVGFASGVFDLFHVGHLNLLENAKSKCDRLVVGVCSDALVFKLKRRETVIPLTERLRIVKALKCVDAVVVKSVDNEVLMAQSVKANIVFKGDDWKNTLKWLNLEKKFKAIGVKVVYFPYTKGISSTKLRGY